MGDIEKGEWQEYRLLILNELKELNEATKAHGLILSEIDKTLIRQADQLTEHMARTELAEGRIEQLHKDVEPIRKANWLASFFLKVSAGISIIIGTFVGVLEILKNLSGDK